MDSAGAVHVFDYLDYRAFLRDYYVDQKRRGRPLSYRGFAKRAGIRSYNYLQLVTKGLRDLSPGMAVKFARGCGLDASEAEYFCELVAFGQARTAEERNRCYARFARFREFRMAHRLEPAQAAYHSAWYVPAIREMADLPEFTDDPKWIAARLEPPVTVSQATEALEVLQTLGLLVRNAAGRLVQASPIVTTGAGPLGHHIVNYHHTMMKQAQRALDEVPREGRDVSSITFAVDPRAVAKIKRRIAEFRAELLQMAQTEGRPEQVYQLNFQLFPLTRLKDGSS